MIAVLTLLTVAILSVVRAEEGSVPIATAESLETIFVNQFPDTPIDLSWENHNGGPVKRKFEARIPPRGGWHASSTFLGHEFSYEVGEERHYFSPPEGNAHGQQFVILAGEQGKKDGFRVQCEVSVYSQKSTETFDIIVMPYWAPRAATRFLELVRHKYYDGVAFNRVVPKFMTRFGIAKDFDMRTMEKENVILDDFDTGVKFEPGFISFAGSPKQHDRRSTELFIVNPGISREQLDRFGEESYEQPFGFVEDVKTSALSKIYSGYGNTGPDTAVMYESDGYDYLKKNFPKLDYIERCFVVDELGLSDTSGEL